MNKRNREQSRVAIANDLVLGQGGHSPTRELLRQYAPLEGVFATYGSLRQNGLGQHLFERNLPQHVPRLLQLPQIILSFSEKVMFGQSTDLVVVDETRMPLAA
jgi:hypothetical protein